MKRLNTNNKFIVNLFLLLLLLIYPTIIFGSDVLEQIDVLDNLRFFSSASDGKYFIFTRYNTAGDRCELIFYDLRKKEPVITVPDLPSQTEYLFSDANYIFIRIGNNFSPQNALVIIDRQNLNQLGKIDLDYGGVNQTFQVLTIGEKLYLIHGGVFNGKQSVLCFIYDLRTLNRLSTKEIETYDYPSSQTSIYYRIDDKIIGIGKNIITYDKDLNPSYSVENKLHCKFGMSGIINGRLYFSDICGKIYEYDLKINERRLLVDLGTLDIPSGLHKYGSLNFDISEDGLLITLHTNKESYPTLIDIKSGKLLKTLLLRNIPDYIMMDNERLYFIYRQWPGDKSKIEFYSINKELLYSEAFYTDHLKEEHERALRVYRETKDFYRSIEILENADIALMIKGDRAFDNKAKPIVINDYAYFLSLTYDRYNEAIPLLEEVIRLSPNRPSAYINLADTYYKVYRYENPQEEVLQKVKNYYETYQNKMNARGEAKKILKRNYSAASKSPLAKELKIEVMGIWLEKILFWKDKIFVADGWCEEKGEYLSIYVYNRDDYSLIKKIGTIKCSHEQQDGFNSLRISDNKLYVRTGYRYEDDKRPNLFIFDLNNYKLLKQYHDNSVNVGEKLWGWLDLPDDPNSQYVRNVMRSGKEFESMHGMHGGFYSTNNRNYLITTPGVAGEKKFCIYNLQTLAVNKDIELKKEGANFYLFDDLAKVAIRYITAVKSTIEIYDIKSKQRQQILSLGNDPGGLVTIAPVLTTFKQYLIIAHRRDIIIYDAKKMQIAGVIKNVIPEFKTEEERKCRRISNLIVDKEKLRLLIFTLSAPPNYFIELNFLEN